jgi:hypothetical protein
MNNHPICYRLPRPGVPDPYWGFSKSYYYEGEKRGWWKLIHIKGEGKSKGITLVPYKEVEKFVRARMK